MSERIGNMMSVVKVTLIERISCFPAQHHLNLRQGKKIQLGATCIWDLKNEQGWLEEVKSHMTEGDPETYVMVSLEEMDANEFHNLPEFEGY